VGRTLAEKLEVLFKAAGNPSLEDVARGIRRGGGPTVSGSYLWLLRTGKKANPTLDHLTAIATFFGVPPTYFFDDKLVGRTEADLALLVALRAPAGRRLLHVAATLSPRSQEALAALADHLAEIERRGAGEPPAGGAARPSSRRRAGPARGSAGLNGSGRA
jgi:transcriptional regulator with XRE-family HTH domain